MDGKNWYQSKTIWLAVLQGLGGIAAAVATSNPALGYALAVKSAVDIILRIVTEEKIN